MYEPHRVAMMLDCSTVDLLAKATFMAIKGIMYYALLHSAGLTGFKVQT